jgi:CIC family chloride channel protein
MNWRWRPLAALVAVALISAAFAVVFRLALGWHYRHVLGGDTVVDAIASLPWTLRLVVPSLGGLAAGLVARALKPRSQGVSNVMEAVALGHVRLSVRTTLARVAASTAAIAAGLSIGREGPLIEFGGSAGAAAARRSDASVDETRVLIAAGTAAGFAAAYNTPFAAVLFVLETLVGIAAPAALLPAMVATAIAAIVTRALVGAGPIYGQRAFTAPDGVHVAWLVVLGLVAAVVAAAFKWLLARAEALMEDTVARQPWRALAGGVIVGLLAVWLPAVAGNGYEPLNQILDQRLALTAVALLLAAKMVATSASVASGIPGGIFTPMLLAGAASGTLFAAGVGAVWPAAAPDAGTCALVGMAATTAASIHAPLTAAVLVFELSGDYAIVVPLILATAAATAVSRTIGSESVYATELRRRGLAWELTLEGRALDPDEPEGPPHKRNSELR